MSNRKWFTLSAFCISSLIASSIQAQSDFDPFDDGDSAKAPESKAKQEDPFGYSDEDRNPFDDNASKRRLAYRLHNDRMEILPIDLADTMTSHTYNVRGILADSMDIQKLHQLVEKRFEMQKKEVSVEASDSNRLIVIAAERYQDQVAEFLATLAE